jgi:indole-3-glycerol phosphate synthase
MTFAGLEEILNHKRAEVAVARSATPLTLLEDRVRSAEAPRNFFAAVTRPADGQTAIIAEVKRRSPSAGLIRPEYSGEGFSPEDIARRYHAAGAAAISCLTDREFFGGDLSYLARIKAAVPLPVLRKDFIIDPWQVWESRAAGADAILLISECLTESMLIDLLILSQQLRLTALVEVHGADHLMRVLPHVGFPHRSYALLGINNRDLTTMRTDLGHTLRLAELIEDRSMVVSESGVRSAQDLARLRRAGVRIALVGEHLMRQADPGEALKNLLS